MHVGSKLMIDQEVERLRGLREVALKMRAIARALTKFEADSDDDLLHRGACAAWRVSREVTGRLRAHPNTRCQQDPSISVVLRNAVFAKTKALTISSRASALITLASLVKSLLRELSSVRALAWSADLSDTLGRSQRELLDLLNAVQDEVPVYSRGSLLPGARNGTAQSETTPFLTI